MKQLKKVWPRRALFYTPASDLRKIQKLTKLSGNGVPDFVALDIEDGVALTAKDAARKNIVEIYDDLRKNLPYTQVGIRLNSISSGLISEDLRILPQLKSAPACLLLPKIDSPIEAEEFLEKYQSIVAKCSWREENSNPIPLVSFIETAIGLLNMRSSFEVLKGAEDLLSHECVVFGSDDFVASIRANRSENGEELMFARQSVVTHASAFDLQSIDMVYINFNNLEGLKQNSIQGANLGFTGKQVIHPKNIEIVQDVFAPSEEKISWATELIEQFTVHQISGKGAFTFRGQMIDMPLVKQANNIISFAQTMKRE